MEPNGALILIKHSLYLNNIKEKIEVNIIAQVTGKSLPSVIFQAAVALR